jgi:hypothetical protein
VNEKALVSRPTKEQVEAFAKLTAEERFNWLMDLLALCFELTPPEIRDRWRQHRGG